MKTTTRRFLKVLIDKPDKVKATLQVLESSKNILYDAGLMLKQEETNLGERLNYSFDFSNYPTGIYRFMMEGNIVLSERFIINKNSKLMDFIALTKVKYDDNSLKHNTLKPFNKDHFINLKL